MRSERPCAASMIVGELRPYLALGCLQWGHKGIPREGGVVLIAQREHAFVGAALGEQVLGVPNGKLGIRL